MRHLNENHNLMMRFAESMGGRLGTELDKETRRRQEAEETVARMRVENEDFKDRQLDREVLRASMLQREKFMGDMLQSLLPLLPMIAGAIIGKLGPQEKNGKHSSVAKLLTQGGSGLAERETMLKTFFAHLSPDEMVGLQDAVKPMNRIALGEIFFAIQKGDEAQRPAIDVGIQKFLKALSSEEVMTIMHLLEPASRERFLAIYKAYGEIETAQQDKLPEILKDHQPAASQNES